MSLDNDNNKIIKVIAPGTTTGSTAGSVGIAGGRAIAGAAGVSSKITKTIISGVSVAHVIGSVVVDRRFPDKKADSSHK